MTTEIERLLQEHATEVQALADRLKDILTAEYDNVWLLRYILSFKTAAEAEEPCRFTIQWRQDNQLDLERIRNGEKPPFADVIQQFQVAGEHKFTVEGEPIFYVRIGLCNTKALMDSVDADKVLHYMIMARAKTVDYCIEESRKRGHFVKAVSVLDFQGFSIARGNDSRFSRIIGESSKISEKLCPQLLGRSVFVNVPSYFMWIFAVIKPLMSKRAVEKIVSLLRALTTDIQTHEIRYSVQEISPRNPSPIVRTLRRT